MEHFLKEDWQWTNIKAEDRPLSQSQRKIEDLKQYCEAKEIHLIELFTAGNTSEEISKMLGISKQGIFVRLKRMGRRLRKIYYNKVKDDC
jgi:DNA-binding CsgD family transcriptional regulator